VQKPDPADMLWGESCHQGNTNIPESFDAQATLLKRMGQNTPTETIHAADEVQRLSCLELRGGNHHARYSVELPGLDVWVSCRPLQPSAKGGDLYYLSVCSKGAVSRITLADVAGHGETVSDAAVRLRDALRLHADHWDQSVLIRHLNDTFLSGGGSTIEFATAFVVSYYGQTGELLFTNAGHPPPLWYKATKREWTPMRESTPWSKSITDLPLGLISGTSYTQTAVELEMGDLLILYTDGVTESVNEADEQLGLKRLLNLARQLPAASATMTGAALLAAVDDYRGGLPAADDVTMVVLQRALMPPSRETPP
jgi:sigma-B regulation protein RsbU (phosphoserine phosphatase)